jgi:hypothetical protein
VTRAIEAFHRNVARVRATGPGRLTGVRLDRTKGKGRSELHEARASQRF